MIWLLALFACDTSCEECEPPDPPSVTLDLRKGSVVDPKLLGEEGFGIWARVDFEDGGCQLDVHLESESGQRRDLAPQTDFHTGDPQALTWDGRDDDGHWFDPGAVHVLAQVTCEQTADWAEDELYVVRLGIAGIDVVDLHGAPEQVPLAWHKLDLWQPGLTLVEEAPEYQIADPRSALDLEDGSPRYPVEPWGDPDAPPWGDGDPAESTHNTPAAFVAGSVAGFTAAPGTAAISARSGLVVPAVSEDAPPLRFWASGSTTEPVNHVPGTAGVFEVPLPDTLGRFEVALTWRWQALSGEGWVDVPGRVETTHVVYMTAGQPQLRDGTELGFAPNVAWVGVLDQTAGDVAGSVDDAEVLDGLREYIHHDPWVIYNPGDAEYSGYSGDYIYWEYAWSDLSDWLDRVEGVDLYCHSVSCLLSVLANHWGVDAQQEVLGVGFTTNLTRAAGTDSWRRWYFNSHSVVSPDQGLTLWDASVDLDGDDAPDVEPVVPVSPMGMDAEEYLWRLTYDDIGIVNDGKCYFR